MREVKQHKYTNYFTTNEAERWLQFVNEELPKRMSEIPSDSHHLSSLHVDDARRLLSLGMLPEAHRFLNIAVDCAVIGIQTWGKEGMIGIMLEGKPYVGPGGTPPLGFEIGDWLDAFCLAIALRRTDAEPVLASYSEDYLRLVPVGVDEYRWRLNDALKCFWRGDPGWKQCWQEAMHLSEPENLSLGSPQYSATLRALGPILHAIDAHDQSAFTEGVVAALMAHRTYWGRGRLRSSPDSLLAIPTIGATALGVQRGLAYEVVSPYAPQWLVLGEKPT